MWPHLSSNQQKEVHTSYPLDYPLDFGGLLDFCLVEVENEVEAVKWRQITDTMLTKYGFRKRDQGIGGEGQE